MLLLSSSHPRAASLLKLAKTWDLPLRELDADEDVPVSALRDNHERVLLAVAAAQAYPALRLWARTPANTRAASLVWIADHAADQEIEDAHKHPIPARPILTLDRNLAPQEVWVESLAWGALVPVFQAGYGTHEDHLLSRVKKLAAGAKDLVLPRELTPAWRVRNTEVHQTLGGWVLADVSLLPHALRGKVIDSGGTSSGMATSLTHWRPVFDDDAQTIATLSGKGKALLNGEVLSVGAAEQWTLHRLDAAPVLIVGR